MSLQRPSKIPDHEASMQRFIELYNKTNKDTQIQPNTIPYEYDLILTINGRKINVEWEKRDNYWIEGKFPFKKLRQFERKFRPEMKVELTLQCNTKEDQFVVAWHKDFESPQPISLSADFDKKEQTNIRETAIFKEFNYYEINKFQQWLLKTSLFVHLNPRYDPRYLQRYLKWGSKPGDKLGAPTPQVSTPLGLECREYMKKNQVR